MKRKNNRLRHYFITRFLKESGFFIVPVVWKKKKYCRFQVHYSPKYRRFFMKEFFTKLHTESSLLIGLVNRFYFFIGEYIFQLYGVHSRTSIPNGNCYCLIVFNKQYLSFLFL
ncbi:MAG: hypothetical protein EAZ41_08470 [Sphingobacteriia bacterium]|nr:MAG: hypothetical protein EAZ41_08470 [Sphingobacteriia bacterium]